MNKKVYCIWVGGTPMSSTRQHSLDVLRKVLGVPVELITDDTLEDYILPNEPFHPAYTYLSSTHKADYIRCYIMHHYGGGYTDIKLSYHSWLPYFLTLEDHPTKWLQGYREISPHTFAEPNEEFKEYKDIMKSQWYNLAGCCAFICKPYSPFTYEWINSVHACLDLIFDTIQKNPATDTRDYIGKELHNGLISTYPLKWPMILGSIFAPLCIKYTSNILLELPPPHFWDYM